MRISTKFRIAAVAPIIMALAVILGLAINYQRGIDSHEDATLVAQVTTDLEELNDLAYSYVLMHEERPLRQFRSKYSETVRLIDQARHDGTAHADHLERIATDTYFIGSLFERIVDNYESSGGRQSPLLRKAEQRLSGQLFVRSRSAAAAAVRLTNILEDENSERQRSVFVVGTGITFVVAALLVIGLLTLLGSILRAIDDLSDGTEEVGTGNLDYRIALRTNDELAELGRSFNRMTQRLQRVTVLKSELEGEVDERTRLAEQLSEERARLQAVLSNMDEAVMVWSREGTLTDINEAAVRIHGAADRAELLGSTTSFTEISFCREDGSALEQRERPAARVLRGESFSDEVLEVDYRRTGKRFFGSYSGSPVRDESGEILFGVVTIHDVTDLHAAQAEAKRELATTQLLLDVADALSVTVSTDSIAKEVARLVEEAVRHTRVSVASFDPSSRVLTATASNGRKPVALGTRIEWKRVSEAVRRAVEERRTDVIDYDALPPEERGEEVAFDGRLALVVPITHSQRVLGLIIVDDPGERQSFTGREIDLVEAMAAQAGVAIENALRYEAERDVAERLQSALLDLPERVRGIEFSQAYHSAAESARVGGDFYDVFEMDDDRVGITIGDVAGKGLPASALTSLVKNAVRAHSTGVTRTPGEVLRLTNELVFRSTSVESFVTVLFAMLSRDDGTLIAANAGHVSGFVRRSGGALTSLDVTGPLLGAFADATFSDLRAEPLAEGDLLFLSTDGLTEARRGRTFFGEQRVREALQTLEDVSPSGAVQRMVREAINFTGGSLNDDLAILAVSRKPTA